MEIKDFILKLKETDCLELKETKKDCLIILNTKLNRKYKVDNTSIEESDWTNLENVLSGRDPIILDGITRIVGYFSKISNWNQSKLGELEDRRTGDYKVDVCKSK